MGGGTELRLQPGQRAEQQHADRWGFDHGRGDFSSSLRPSARPDTPSPPRARGRCVLSSCSFVCRAAARERDTRRAIAHIAGQLRAVAIIDSLDALSRLLHQALDLFTRTQLPAVEVHVLHRLAHLLQRTVK